MSRRACIKIVVLGLIPFSSKMDKRIAIIGAGVSGLLACKHALGRGLNPIVFEARSGIGGVWSQTIESTKLQSPKHYYQFSDFPWPASVRATFPDHNQVMDYLDSYALHFNLFPRIKFNSRVIGIDYFPSSPEDMLSWDLWGGTGEAFSPAGIWKVTVQDLRHPSAATEEHEVDFVIVCTGRYSDLPNIPDFPLHRGPEVFDGKVMHSMDYAAMEDESAAELTNAKRITVVGFQKSAVDIAAEIAKRNGKQHPCTLLYKTAHWMVPDYLLSFTFKFLNRFIELMVHKPREGFFTCLLALLFSPWLWIFSKLVESYLRWIHPLRKHNLVPDHRFLRQISSCMFTVLPSNFFDCVKEGGLILKKSKSFSFFKDGLIIDGDPTPLDTDIVIFATGYRSDEKLKNTFTSSYFQKCIIGSSAPFYRECIHPRIPQLAVLGYADSPAILYTTEMRSKWVSHFLAAGFKLPPIREMEEEVMSWERCLRRYTGEGYRRSCASVLLQIHCNDKLCQDMGCNPRRKKWFLSEMFAPYGPTDYANLGS